LFHKLDSRFKISVSISVLVNVFGIKIGNMAKNQPFQLVHIGDTGVVSVMHTTLTISLSAINQSVSVLIYKYWAIFQTMVTIKVYFSSR